MVPSLTLARFPRNARCAVTTSWDDNDCANMEIMKILDSMKLKGTFYVDMGNPRWANNGLEDSDLQLLSRQHELGSHTWTHINVRNCGSDELREELEKSKKHLETVTGQPVLGFAYPYGAYSPQCQKLAREASYLFARATVEGKVEFPPADPYLWGISVFVMERSPHFLRTLVSKKTILTKRGRLYLKNLATSWRGLALKLFEQAQRANGVWHLAGHASEVLKPGARSEFLEVCRHVALRDDVWYATNGMLFLMETIRNRVKITASHTEMKAVFRVRCEISDRNTAHELPIPLRLEVPNGWCEDYTVEVKNPSRKVEMGKLPGQAWIDIYDDEAAVTVFRE